jgi:hypothetical protein
MESDPSFLESRWIILFFPYCRSTFDSDVIQTILSEPSLSRETWFMILTDGKGATRAHWCTEVISTAWDLSESRPRRSPVETRRRLFGYVQVTSSSLAITPGDWTDFRIASATPRTLNHDYFLGTSLHCAAPPIAPGPTLCHPIIASDLAPKRIEILRLGLSAL